MDFKTIDITEDKEGNFRAVKCSIHQENKIILNLMNLVTWLRDIRSQKW